MVSQDRRMLLDYLWDRAYARGIGSLIEDILTLEKGR